MRTFSLVSQQNGLWQKLVMSWKAQCIELNGDPDVYETGDMAVVKALAEGVGERNAGIYALHKSNDFYALCQLNCSYLTGYTGKVLRVRFVTLSPKYDLGEYPVEEYVSIISDLFNGVLGVSDNYLQSDHVKFHLNSPGDRNFFMGFSERLRQSSGFVSVAFRGSWLYISK